MAKTLYFGNLPWKTNEEELSSFIEPHAPVIAARIIKEKETGRSKGYGFVEVNDEHAEKIMTNLNGATLGGRTININEAKRKEKNG
ncbi:RNA-binding protein [candidate division WOR-1 bacterium RIFOXYD2_FULL_36_8]|uniref:RNA-binding protein n=1 Tax=candidate division WOR-1 bacterium RIFOXYB2_FULL_36_35 TaxID=1802578 RepID=A0A1F4S2G9_UNCSA|nr:MAG: RNA-binding protein [candidate division WOR-1 bacterium RIFOXYA2_FULL_36_21]OGC14635.1 MAG: RNA-binding protein [candidate division WOR-1 bacterium RIFOXYB2_FULL_36_35]OGC19653.1 MAG: RNA-binding protein [candidate division WOR-1 bacterium RIFOXYA12_FULL_36_13]OGC41385.1 MAG: RNA-binding protein [candidate division WOR-1 bacterium RIFOXYD2_FULL_36_8]